MFNLSDWDAGWWLWVVIDIAAVLVLAAAIIYGSRMWQKRSQNPQVIKESDDATRRLYHREDDVSERPYR